MESKPSPRKPGRPRGAWVALGLLGLSATVIAIASRAIPPKDVSRAGPTVGGPGRIVGDGACRECHPAEAARHQLSGHSTTLRPAGQTELAGRLLGRVVGDPERPGVTWTYSLRGGRLAAERVERGRVQTDELDFALGSGRHATTFVALDRSKAGSPGSLEHRLTYFARDHSLGLTPGQKAADLAPGMTPMGRSRGPGETLHCFGCHVTTVSDRSPKELDPVTMRPGIGCERCHGPGRDHIEAARRGAKELTMPFGKVWTADGQMRLCGDCHRHPSQAPAGEIRPDNPKIARFQPVGLMQSACYTRSGGRLSCTNCHDPHARASTDRSLYGAVCLSCHVPPERAGCPVSPRGDCIACHMPAVDTGQGISYTDHWIRARKGP